MIKVFPALFWFFLVLSFSACTIEEARPSKKQEIVIASDCLESKDVILFHSFEKSLGIQIEIRHFRSDSLKQLLVREGVETEIDVVILSSIYAMNQLDNSNLLQVIQSEKFPKKLAKNYRSKKSTWAGIGIDPYVIAVSKDSTNKIKNYADLLDESHTIDSLQNAAFYYPFYASILHKSGNKNRRNSVNWIKKMNQNSAEYASMKDTVVSNSIYLTSYSEYHSKKNNDFKIIFPNQSNGGSYYNMACFGIVNQARNYENALAFFDYILNESVNKRLNNRWKIFPILSSKKSSYPYQNNEFKKTNWSPIFLEHFYPRIRKILK